MSDLPRGALRRGLGPTAALLLLLGAAVPVWAEGPSAGELATYERARVESVLVDRRLRRAASAEGRTVAYVRHVRDEVFDRDDLAVPLVLPDFAPDWPNHFHWLTEESTVRREVLLRQGEPFRQALADESMRNLRALGVFSLVSIVAVETGDPAHVGVVVYTRDLWSLRLEQAFAGVGTTFALDAALVERNFLGRNKTLSLRFGLETFTYRVGETYLDPRVNGGGLRLYEAFDVTMNRDSGRPEGSASTLLFGRPFYDLAQTFAFDLLAYYRVSVQRGVSGGRIVGFDTRAGDEHGKRCSLAQAGCVAKVWEERALKVEAGAHHRVGDRYKHTFSAGAGFKDRDAEANSESGLQASERDVFEAEVLPRVRREAYPFLGYRLADVTYVSFEHLATFGQTESVRVGPFFSGRLAAPLEVVGSTDDALVASAGAGYVWAEHDALVDALMQARARLERVGAVDRGFVARLRAASPSIDGLYGRLVLHGVLDARDRDTQNTLVTLGGDAGLRGYPSQYFYGFGVSRWVSNVEYRTRPWMLQSIHLGLVAFYDVGSVYASLRTARVHHAAGAGVRVLFPHFNRHVFRLDAGVPLDGAGFAVTLSYGSSQAVALTPEEDALAAGLDLD
jgi:hypothetical protein